MVFSKSLLSAETSERVCLKAREINSKEKCLFKMYVLCGHSGAQIHIPGRGATQRPEWGPPRGAQGRPGPLGVDSRPGRDQSSGEGIQSDCTCKPLPGWGLGEVLKGAAGRERREGGPRRTRRWVCRQKSPRKPAALPPAHQARLRAPYSAVPNE